MASTRLRKAFRYPDDSDEHDPIEGIDEQEQEELITNLQDQDAANTALYTKLFAAFPLLCTIPYLSTVHHFGSTLSITSLISTSYILFFVPLIPGTPRSNLAFLQDEGMWKAWREVFDENGPVNKFIIPLNGALAAILGLQGYVKGRKAQWADGDGMWDVLPLVVLLFILLIRTQLRPVNVEHLEKLRYRYKGA